MWTGRLPPAAVTLRTQAIYQRLVALGLAASTSVTIPVPSFFSVALAMGNAKVAEIIGATKSAGAYVLHNRAFAGARVEAERSATDEAFANPIVSP